MNTRTLATTTTTATVAPTGYSRKIAPQLLDRSDLLGALLQGLDFRERADNRGEQPEDRGDRGADARPLAHGRRRRCRRRRPLSLFELLVVRRPALDRLLAGCVVDLQEIRLDVLGTAGLGVRQL